MKVSTSKIRISASAVENWARFRNKDILFLDARQALLEEIKTSGKFTPKSPGWMSSPKPGVELWIHLNDISLTLVKDTEDNRYQYWATNALAPKSVRKRAELLGIPLKRNSFSEEDIKTGNRLSSKQLSKKVTVSKHALERLESRLQMNLTKEEVQIYFSRSAEFFGPPPDWANIAQKSNPVLIALIADEKVAFPLGHDGSSDWVATTAIPYSWSQADLLDLSGEDLLSKIYISSSFKEEYGDNIKETILTAGSPVIDNGVRIFSEDLVVTVRPLKDYTDKSESWFVSAVNTTN